MNHPPAKVSHLIQNHHRKRKRGRFIVIRSLCGSYSASKYERNDRLQLCHLRLLTCATRGVVPVHLCLAALALELRELQPEVVFFLEADAVEPERRGESFWIQRNQQRGLLETFPKFRASGYSAAPALSLHAYARPHTSDTGGVPPTVHANLIERTC